MIEPARPDAPDHRAGDRADLVVGPFPAMPTPTPVWLLQGRWPLFGWVHEPRAAARGSVVLVPPLLGEYAAANALYRTVAVALARQGLLAVRFDHEGTGDSAGPTGGPGRTTAWLDGLDQAVALARSRCAGPVTLLGVRSGALLAAHAAVRRQDVDALVLWDPWQSGRAFLRRQRALQALRLPGPAASADLEVPGFALDPATVKAIESLRLPGGLPVRKALHVARPKASAPVPLALRRGNADDQEEADLLLAAKGEQEACFEAEPMRHQVPKATAAMVVDWVADTADELAREGTRSGARPGGAPARPGAAGHDAPCRVVLAAQPVTMSPGAPGDVTVTERALCIGHGLFAIETMPAARGERPPRTPSPPAAGPPATVLFLSSGTDSHVGPVRLWVTLARRFAARGIRSVRVDLSGLGESPARAGQPEGVIRLPGAFDDVVEVVDALGGPERLVLAGLCSGAYQALESALEVKPLGVLGINPLLRFTPPEVVDGGRISTRRRLCQERPLWVDSARRALPDPVGRAMASGRRLLEGMRARRRRDATWVDELAGAGVRVYCVCGEDEARQLADAGMTDRGAAGVRVDVLPGLDHGLVVAEQRDAVVDRLTVALTAMTGRRVLVGHDDATRRGAVAGDQHETQGGRSAVHHGGARGCT